MKIPITPVPYRAGTGVSLEITKFEGLPPVNVTWQICTDTGSTLETGTAVMSDEQWINWPAGNDNNYAERCVAAEIGVAVLE